MFIQFAGYDIQANSRIYNFDVLDPPREARKFTVRIESATSRWASLQLQDGPSICFERLRCELERETPALRTESHLRIGEQDVQEYLARQHPPKRPFGHKSPQAFPLHPHDPPVFAGAEEPGRGLRTGKYLP
jgi:hypothetical protein